MLALKIIIFVLGLAFTLFGYFIFFKKKYSLINGFEGQYKAGQKTEKYARCVGLAELIIGFALLTAAVVLIIVA